MTAIVWMNVLCSVCNHFTLSVVPLVRNRLVLSVVHFVVCVIIWFSVSFILCEMILLPTPFSPSLLISTLLSTNINFIAISSGQPPKSPFSVFASSAVLNVQTVAISTFSAGSIDSRRTLSCFLLTVSSCFYPCSLLAVTSCFLCCFFLVLLQYHWLEIEKPLTSNILNTVWRPIGQNLPVETSQLDLQRLSCS